jgi:hypothetical protein
VIDLPKDEPNLSAVRRSGEPWAIGMFFVLWSQISSLRGYQRYMTYVIKSLNLSRRINLHKWHLRSSLRRAKLGTFGDIQFVRLKQ